MIDYTPKATKTKFKRFGRGPTPVKLGAATAVVKHQPIRATQPLKSMVTPGGSTALKPTPVYTGSACVGISQMAKSNAVPVFNTDAIIDIARMRR